jgi:hypothetical protein
MWKYLTVLRHSRMFVLKFELILIIGSNKVLTEGARKVYRGRGCCKACLPATHFSLWPSSRLIFFVFSFHALGTVCLFLIFLMTSVLSNVSFTNRFTDPVHKSFEHLVASILFMWSSHVLVFMTQISLCAQCSARTQWSRRCYSSIPCL